MYSIEQLMEKYADAKLDDILDIPDAHEKSRAVDAWIAAGDASGNPLVKIRTSDNKPLHTTVPEGFGKKFSKHISVDHNGRKVTRRIAVTLLEKYGERGYYRNCDPASGYEPIGWAKLKVEQPGVAQAMALVNNYPKGEPQFLTNYLYHDTEEPENAEE